MTDSMSLRLELDMDTFKPTWNCTSLYNILIKNTNRIHTSNCKKYLKRMEALIIKSMKPNFNNINYEHSQNVLAIFGN